MSEDKIKKLKLKQLQEPNEQEDQEHKNKDKLNKNKSSEKECVELKNIKYKTMLLNGNFNTKETKENSVINIDEFLEKEKELNDKEHWNRLDKTLKIKKIGDFASRYGSINGLNVSETKKLKEFLIDAIDKRRINKSKDLSYDRENGIIKNIPNLEYNKKTSKFHLKKTEKNSSVLRSVAPKQTRKIKAKKPSLKDKDKDKDKKNKE